MQAGLPGRHVSTSATGSWRPFCATAASDDSITSCCRTAIPTTSAGQRRSSAISVPARYGRAFRSLVWTAHGSAGSDTGVGGGWANVHRGDRLLVDGVTIAAHHPAPADWERQKVRNDDSIVLDLRWRDVSVLLTGDIGRDVERTLAGEAPAAPLRVLKVPHHGSLTSSSREFLQAVRPRIAVFSAGRANHFGHPAPAVLERYREVGAAIFRTDQDGAVMLDTDGYSIDVHTFTGRRLSIQRP